MNGSKKADNLNPSEQPNRMESRLKAAIDGHFDGILFLDAHADPSGKIETFLIQELNHAAESILGRSREEVIGAPIESVFPKALQPTLARLYLDAYSNGRPAQKEFSHEFEVGEQFWLQHQVQPVEGGLVLTLHDLTARKNQEQILSFERSFFRKVLDTNPALVYVVDIEGKMKFANKAALRFLGLTERELFNRTEDQLFRPANPDEQRASNKRVIESRQTVNMTVFLKGESGVERWLDTVKTPLENIDGSVHLLLAVSTDVTERKRSEQARDRLISVIETTPDLVCSMTPNGEPHYVNPAGRALLGLTDNWQGKIRRVGDFHERAVADFLREVAVPHAMEHGMWQGETVVISCSGERIPVWQAIIAHRGEQGQLSFLSTVMRDIRPMKEAERKIDQQRQYLSAIMDALPDLIFVLNEELVFEDTFRSDRGVLRLAPEFFVGRQLNEILPSEVIERASAAVKRALTGGEVTAFEYTVDAHDDRLYYEARVSRLDERRVVVVCRNVTAERKTAIELEAERGKAMASAKMAALGEMAAGIAHEINNPLAVISGKVQQLRAGSTNNTLTPERLREQLEKVHAMTDRIAKIIRGLRSFARDGSRDPFAVKTVRCLVEETVELCAARFKNHSVRLEVGPIDPALTMECRNVQISQVLLNLLNNSFDAVNGKDDAWIRVECWDLGAAVEISVTDSGPGIPDEVATKIMTPFFTTKEIGKGTGLGLSISKGIVESHNGRLLLDRVAVNTRFVLILPKVQLRKEPAA